jgi:hypothetical protein
MQCPNVDLLDYLQKIFNVPLRGIPNIPPPPVAHNEGFCPLFTVSALRSPSFGPALFRECLPEIFKSKL